MTASTDEKTLMEELLSSLRRIAIILTNWSIFTSFIEADWWHFTDPATTGINLPAASAFAAIFCVSPAIFLCKSIRQTKLPPVLCLLFTMLAPSLLVISSLPKLDSHPVARTGLLGFGVLLIPYVIIWLLSEDVGGLCKRRSKNLCRKMKKEHSARRISTLPLTCTDTEAKSEFVKFPSCQLSSHPGIEFLIAVSLMMTIRWCAGTINILYEVWEAASVLAVCVLTLSLPRFISKMRRTTKCCEVDNSSSRKSTALTTASCSEFEDHINGEMSTATHLIDTCASISSDIYRNLEENHSQSTSTDSSNIHIALTKQVSQTQDDTPPSFLVITSKQKALMWCGAIVHGLSIGTLGAIFLQVFGTPALLCRWSGRPPYPYQIVVLALYALGVIISAFHLEMKVLRQCKTPQLMCKTEFCFEVVVTKLLQISIIAILVATMVISTILLMNGSVSWLAFVGAGLMCVLLPFMLSVNFQSVAFLVKSSYRSQNAGKSPPMSGVILWLAAVSFFFSYLLCIMFINPQITSAVLGRMDIILSAQIGLISLSLFSFLLIGWYLANDLNKSNSFGRKNLPPSSFSESFRRKFIPRKRPFTLSFLTILFLTVGILCGQRFAPKRCSSIHRETFVNISNYRDGEIFKANSSFSVMSWNLLLGHDMMGNDNLPCIGGVINHIKPDVIGIQESDALPPYWGGKDVINYLETYLGGFLRSYLGVSPLKSNLGVGMLARLNVIYHESNLLPEDEAGKLPHYSVMQVDVTVANVTVHIFNIHAAYKNWTATSSNPSPFANTSRRHIEFLAQKIKTLKLDEPVIAMGDFNLNPHEPELNIIRDTLGLKSALEPTKTRPTTLRNRFAIVDHIFYRGLNVIGSKTVTETRSISDHHPVLAYFEIPT